MQKTTRTQRRLAAAQQLLAQTGSAALLVSDALDIRYLMGLTGSREERESFILLTPRACVHFIDARRQGGRPANNGCVVRTIDGQHPIEALLADAIGELGAGGIAIDGANLTVAELERFQKALTGVAIKAAPNPISRLRLAKDANEVAAIKRAVAIADQAFATLLPTIKVGDTERAVAWRLEKIMRDQGADGVSFPLIVAVGAGSAVPHYTPGDVTVQKGQNILLDFGCVVDGYCSDITRTVFMGEVSAKQRAQYEAVREAQFSALATLKPGIRGATVDTAARAVIAKAGFPTYNHGLGHGVGLAIHEAPYLRPNYPDALAPGAVFSIEPGVYLPGVMGVRIEDLVLMTKAGPAVLTQAPKEFITL